MRAFAILLWGGYVRHWAWTGFGDNDMLWDWLELFLLPTAVATLPLWLRPMERKGLSRSVEESLAGEVGLRWRLTAPEASCDAEPR
jgi:hypothetical protein